jgi:hypothetical protein
VVADRVAYGSLPFKEQIAFFRNKRNVLTEAWTDVWEAEHDHAFMVAGANRIDLLIDLRAAVDKAISQGTGLEAFRRDFDAIVAKYGWAYKGGRNWRTRVIYETNLRTSYAAGRYAQLQALKKVRPYWLYRHSDAVQHPRPMHLAWGGMVLDADDPWWNMHYPPNGWGCQCTVEALNARDLKRMGKDGPDTAPPVNMQRVLVGKNGPHPREVETPAGVDPGFGYAPGKSAFERGGTPPTPTKAPTPPTPAKAPSLPPAPTRPESAPPQTSLAKTLQKDRLAKITQETLDKATQLPALAGAEALAELLDNPRVVKTLDDTFSVLQLLLIGGSLLAATKPDDPPPADMVVGAFDPDLVRALSAAGVTPPSAVIRVAPGAAGNELAGNLPVVLRDARAVLLDPSTGVVMYVDADAATAVGLRVVWVQPGAGSANYAGAMRASQDSLQARLDAGELLLLRGEL